MKECQSLEGRRYTNYLGFVHYGKHYSFIKIADIGIVNFLPLPNQENALPNKPFEYMAAGLPVIASDFPLWKKIIDDAGCGICVNPASPREIAEAILHLFNNPQLRKQMGENGRRAVEEKYNWERESKKLLTVYEKLS